MAVMRCCSLLMAGLMMVGGVGSVAQTQSLLTVEQNQLARMEQSLENRLVEVEDMENELLSHDYKLKRAQEALGSVRSNYEQSRRELQQAERDHSLNSSPDSERQLHKARHSFSMAERGVDSRSRRIEIIQSNYGELKSQLDEARAAATQSKNRIAEQQRKVEQMVQAMLVKAEAAERAAATRRVAPPVSKPQVPPPSVAALKPVVEAAQAQPAPELKVDPELLDYVRREDARLQKLLQDNVGSKQTFRNLELNSSKGESLPFEFLGHNQYRLVAPVSAGQHTYKINTWKFRRTIPAADEGVPYVFIFDARRLSRPRLVMYPEYVLSRLE